MKHWQLFNITFSNMKMINWDRSQNILCMFLSFSKCWPSYPGSSMWQWKDAEPLGSRRPEFRPHTTAAPLSLGSSLSSMGLNNPSVVVLLMELHWNRVCKTLVVVLENVISLQNKEAWIAWLQHWHQNPPRQPDPVKTTQQWLGVRAPAAQPTVLCCLRLSHASSWCIFLTCPLSSLG